MSQDFNMDAMMNAFTHKQKDEKLVVMAEDLQQEGGGMDYSKIFFEPQVGKSYTIKFITNPFGDKITHRKVYKALPDPKRKGKTFQYVSSGSAKTCEVLELFFELHALKKAGDSLAIQKIEQFLGMKQQACVIIQIHASEDESEIGNYRLFTFSTFGPNPTIANMINSISNPTEAQIREGEVREDIFNIFESTAMVITCEEAEFEGIKGRDFGKSSWSKKKRGAFVVYENEAGQKVRYEFNPTDKLETPEAQKAFKHLITTLQTPELSIHNYFGYKQIGDKLNTEETEKYLIDVNAKVKEILPIIRNAQSVAEVKNYGIAAPEKTNRDSATLIGTEKASDILKDSIPSELSSSILNAAEPVASVVQSTPATNSTVADILGS